MKHKRILSLLLTALMVVTGSVSVLAFLPGDLDGDGRISASDARTILRAAAFLDPLNANEEKTADIDGDGRVTATDARIALRIAASLDKIDNYIQEEEKEPAYLPRHTAGSDGILAPHSIYEKACTFTAEIHIYNDAGRESGIATGFFVTEDGILITNYHVIENARYIRIKTQDGSVYDVTSVLGYDKAKDIAILLTDATDTAFALTAAGDVRVGDSVYVLGSTLGLTGTFTNGMVSAVDRVLDEKHNGVGYLQITAPIAKGNSGGPVLNDAGNVVGIASMSEDSAQNLNFAIPIEEIYLIDISAPQTLEELSQPDDDFDGSLTLSASGVTLRPYGTALFYAVISASEECGIVCKSDNEAVTVRVGRNYGAFTVVYVSAETDSGGATVSVAFDGHEEYMRTFSVVIGDGSGCYFGVPGSVPDFGVLAERAPDDCDEGTVNNVSVYSFRYTVPQEEKDTLTERYITLMAQNGYTCTGNDGNSVSFSDTTKKINALLRFSPEESGYSAVLYISVANSAITG